MTQTEADAGDGASTIESIAALPLFFRLEGRRAALAGGGAAAAWKAELLAAAGADVFAYAPKPGAALRRAAAREKRINLIERAWRRTDLEGAGLAVLEAESDEEAGAFRTAARAAGVPVNVVDRPAFSDFSFATIVNRSPLVVGISTDGAAPVLGQAIRARIEALLPASLGAWAKAASGLRTRLSALGLGFPQRRAFWERFAARALSAGDRQPGEADFSAFADAERASFAPTRGRIYLVGAGPGDPELMTMKAVRALQSADVVLHDRLLSPRALELARREAQRIDVGKRAGEPSPRQEEITAQMIALAREGKTVVRLKGGDPGVFGRTSEETAAARAAGISVTVIPGVTAALAAAAELGVSLTDRERTLRLQFVTAHDGAGELSASLSWSALADAGATTAVYMGRRTLEDYIARVLAAGLDPAMPAVYLERVSLEGAARFAAPIARLPARLAGRERGGPALLLYGHTLGNAGEGEP